MSSFEIVIIILLTVIIFSHIAIISLLVDILNVINPDKMEIMEQHILFNERENGKSWEKVM